MGIAFFLDPAQDPNGFVGKDRKNSKKQIRKMAKRLGYTLEEVDQAYHEAGVFWNLKRDWTPKQRRIESRSAPLEWWGDERDSYPVLSRIARRVFTMPTSSAASERNWSAHKFVYSDRRVNLGLDKINMLISMYWDRLEKKPLPRVIFNSTTLQTAVTSEGDDDEEENRIHYEAHDSDGEENYEHEVLAQAMTMMNWTTNSRRTQKKPRQSDWPKKTWTTSFMIPSTTRRVSFEYDFDVWRVNF
ncbi:hypothetical protein PHYSODRAFT_522858 [Phytophthora sojae]|uniref:HAT C-terminal dimerisation domain-containing protein n=1 Tax=Phytophthora sojae (strain P6497) TaxID=1094619 RepID=G5A2S9_PHYSP|nr:hypothetical protein PHYSODRAFT_522858 [Phytophthora sojae]EGZ09969.1 hypothetical protein PHYSODRAFT_522858 [Phytophthora sojae]|eukprot:XP_009534830.1 hypothetical protein PHYSODRAFT_522858 [Phytophthora sojae]